MPSQEQQVEGFRDKAHRTKRSDATCAVLVGTAIRLRLMSNISTMSLRGIWQILVFDCIFTQWIPEFSKSNWLSNQRESVGLKLKFLYDSALNLCGASEAALCGCIFLQDFLDQLSHDNLQRLTLVSLNHTLHIYKSADCILCMGSISNIDKVCRREWFENDPKSNS